MKMNRKIKIIACAVLENEIKAAAGKLGITISEEYLTAGLHEQPDKLRKELQQAVDHTSDVDAIVIGYGLCGRGTVGIRARNIPLIMPRVHDCIALFLGSHKRYKQQFAGNPGTFYMTSGWYEHKTQPLSVKRKKDRPVEGNWDISAGFEAMREKYGAKNAEDIYEFLNSWKKNYNRSVYIDTGAEEGGPYELYAKDLAKELDWKYEKVKGSLDLFLSMMKTEESNEEILVLKPGQITAYDPLKHGLYSYNPEAGSASLWERALPQGVPAQDRAEIDRKETLGLGIDAGGTYTDAVIYNFKTSEVLSRAKAPTTKWDFTTGIHNALSSLDGGLLSRVGITVVSTTLATNAIVEDLGRKVGLLLMPLAEMPENYLDHNPWQIVSGSLSIQGDELERVSEDEIKRVALEMIEHHGVQAFAVSGYGSTINPAHELLIKRVIEAETGLGVCCGHELSNTLNFFVRANTAVLNAGIIPLIEQFIADLETSLKKMNIGGKLMIVRGDGTLMSRGKAVLHPVETTLSGPAASIAGARFLTGSRDAVIIDVGGTTSDIGLITAGKIRLTEEGARVGRWRTHIRAVDMATLGAGGDSRILIYERELSAGPRRIAPAGRLSDMGGHEAAFEFLEELHSDYYNSTEAMEILALTGRQPNWKLSYDEEQVLRLLEERPYSVKELAVKLKHGLWNILNTRALESSAVVQRYGLTPTDILAARAEVNIWPGKLSEKLFKLYAAVWGTGPDELYSDVFELISDNLLQTLVLQELDVPGDAADRVMDAPTFKALLRNLKGESRALSLSPSLKKALVGVGAAAPWLLERLAGHLGVKLIIPENADVANAVGAVCSMVTVRREASVTPGADGSFLVNGFDDISRFEAYEDACSYLEKRLAEEIIKEAVMAGTDEKKINWRADNRLSETSDGSSIFLGRDYTAEITGLPA